MPPCRPAALVLALLLALAAPAAAQEVPADTARALAPAAPAVPDTAGAAAGDTAVVEGISPRGAFLRSLVLPGWGQSEIGAPVRGGVYFALEAGSLWMLYKSDTRLRQALEQERVVRETGELPEGNRLPLVRDRQNQREDWITLSIFWLFFAGADAFVAAHLRDFDLHVGGGPRPDGAVELRATVPLRP